MAGNRGKAEAFILKYIEKLADKFNREIYEKLFADMSDKQFDDFMKGLEEGSVDLAMIEPNFTDTENPIQKNLDLADELGHNFFERIWMSDDIGTPSYLSNIPYLVIDLPVRRQSQLLDKKVSIPEDNRSVDDLTGQPTGKSKGSRISYPETNILAAMNLDSTLIELLKFRGGDGKAFNAMNKEISNTGAVSLNSIYDPATKVRSTTTLSAYLKGMHLDNTL